MVCLHTHACQHPFLPTQWYCDLREGNGLPRSMRQASAAPSQARREVADRRSSGMSDARRLVTCDLGCGGAVLHWLLYISTRSSCSFLKSLSPWWCKKRSTREERQDSKTVEQRQRAKEEGGGREKRQKARVYNSCMICRG